MANIATTLNAWSTTAGSNQPDSADSLTLQADLQQIQAVVRQMAASSTIASGSTTDLSTINETFITVSGVTTITSFGTLTAGMFKWLVFSGALTLTHNGTSLILPTSANITTVAGDTALMLSLGSGNWRCLSYNPISGVSPGAPTKGGIQSQTYTAYTTGGSSTAFTLTPTPAISANAENQEFDVEFHTAAGTTPTLAVSGQTALNLKYRDSTGAKQAVTSAQVPSGWRSRVTHDGTDWVVRESADAIHAAKTAALSAGYSATPYSAGTKSSGTFTPDEANGNFQYYTNGGAHTLAPPTNNCTLIIQVTNDGSAGTITTSGFTKVTGATPGTTNGDDFIAYVTKINGFSHLNWQALQ